MFNVDYKNINLLDFEKKKEFLHECNILMSKYSAEERISWALKKLPGTHIMSSSFGIQSVVLLHLVVQQKPDIPIILIDTGYLFPQTYRFIDTMKKKLNLNLKVFRSSISPAWQESRYGKLWEQGIKGIDLYNQINKIEPMNLALKELSVKTWLSGLRHQQSNSRKNLPYVAIQKGVFKILPILNWSNDTIYKYIKNYNLDNHPLLKDGYISVGDIHTTKKYTPGMLEEETRFFGLKRECGLHDDK
ncbi:phosphoadenylyl-sulfate reductase [Buchnera aphidicola (Aphis helianthi)]|uniref:Phosphoadenosine 5'-phosphosulfate reductase n=1 Tax=Buchnera aphidicola (Aphis helianthi) TaxID=2315802 RepID=A0A4D6XX63_9GAMM|nr:phosphoadenylyl-sulfate reductase [Buchnera aphidicola]QCI17235.1 phosphoadenylyl-sulfate reductase [Buchnera aphidicola (Aphis helianthi)]